MNTDQSGTQSKTNASNPPTGFLKWLPLLVLSLALSIIILDAVLITVTIKGIILDLNTTLQKILWAITAYSLILAAFTVTGGRLGDLFGRKKMFVAGAAILAAGSFLSSISHGVGIFIIAKAIVQGIGACLMIPATLSLLRSTYKDRDLQVAFGIWGGIAAGVAALGPVLGGWLTTHYSWRWAFRMNVFVAAVLILTSVFVKEYRETEEKPTLDIGGVILSALGMFSMVFGFVQASTYGWWHEKAPLVLFNHVLHFGGISATPVFIALGIIILGTFVWWESFIEKRGKTPLVSLELFSNKTFMTGAGIGAILALGQAALTFTIPIYLQAVLKLNPLQTGLALVPLTSVILIASPLSAYASKYISPKLLIQIGIILDVLSFLVMRQSLRVGATQWVLAPGFVLFGIGIGIIIAQLGNLTLSAVSVEQSGEASGVSYTIRTLGQTLGTAIVGAILISVITTHITTGIQNSSVIPSSAKPALTREITSRTSNQEFESAANLRSHVPAAVAQEAAVITNEATVKSSKTAFSYGILFIVLALLVSTKLPEGKKVEAKSAAHHPEVIVLPPKKVGMGS